MLCELLQMEEFEHDVLDFIADPQNSYYNSIYQQVMETMRDENGQSKIKKSLDNILTQIYDKMNKIIEGDENTSMVDAVYKKLCYFNQKIKVLLHLFIFYDSSILEKSDSVIEMAIVYLVKFFTQEKPRLKKYTASLLNNV